MSQTDYDKLKNSLAELIEQHKNLSTIDKKDLPNVTERAAQIAVIKCFEVCFDMAWKHLKRRLIDKGVPNLPNNPKDMLRLGAENYFLENAGDWFNYMDKRNDTAHDYNERKANETLEVVPDFIEDAIDLYEAMTGEEWDR